MNVNPQINFPLWLLQAHCWNKKKMFRKKEKQVQTARLQTRITVIRIKPSIPCRLISL